MKNRMLNRLIKNWITSTIGLSIMVLSVMFFYRKLDVLGFQEVITGALLCAVGFVFLYTKDKIITSFFQKKTD